jgi:hypothetical protein
MPPLAWLALLMVGMPVFLYLPTDLILRRLIPPPARAVGADAGPREGPVASPTSDACSTTASDPLS